MLTDLALHATGLHFAFDNTLVLVDVSIQLHWGTLTAITGANGAGKSTLIEILAGVRDPQRGHVQRNDEVSLVVQRPNAPDSLPLTVREVVSMGTWNSGSPRWRRSNSHDRRARVDDALDRTHLADLAARPFSQLSGGQRQRTLIAQGLARRAGILLLDEPAAGLDAHSRSQTRDILAAEAAKGLAVACVTHDEESIKAADRVIRLHNGSRVA